MSIEPTKAGAKHRPLPPEPYLRECFWVFGYEGKLVWRERPVAHFKATEKCSAELIAKRWNAAWTGKTAGFVEKDGRRWVRLDGVLYRHSRLFWVAACLGPDPGQDELDHENGDHSDDRAWNLRPGTHCQNMRNVPVSKRNRSGTVGVYRYRASGKWRATIRVDGKPIEKAFDTLEEAAAWRRAQEIKHYGEFAPTREERQRRAQLRVGAA